MPYEIVGDADLLGATLDDVLSGGGYGDEILGRVQRGKVVARQPDRMRRLILGIGSTSIAATSSAVVTVTPQVPFRLERFTTKVVGLQVSDIKVGTQSQFVGAGSVPIEVFAPDSTNADLKGDTAVPGVDIALLVSNPGSAAVTLTGAYLGTAAV